jgi:hypothetical protein
VSAIHRCGPAFVLAAAVLFAGCGTEPRQNAVSGTVTWKGKPVKSGTINFSSADGKFVATGTIVDGKYEIPQVSGIPAGNYLVAISYPDPNVPAPRPDEPPGESTQVRELLPAKYADGTELKAAIKDGANAVNFDLT